MTVPVTCFDCHTSGTVKLAQLTRPLICQCGSDNLGLNGVDSGVDHVAKAKGPGTGWGKKMPDPLKGWNEYVGPPPSVTHRDPQVADTGPCPVCHGSGRDNVSDRSACRECGGTGHNKPTTSRPTKLSNDPGTPLPSGGAHWAVSQMPGGLSNVGGRKTTDPMGSNQDYVRTTTPGFGERGQRGPVHSEFDPDDAESYYPKATRQSPRVRERLDRNYRSDPKDVYRMDKASCPHCGLQPTHLTKDKNEDAWWNCAEPGGCGPLANIDKHPEINPYDPPKDFVPDRNMKKAGSIGRNRKTGRLMAMLAVIHEHNELSPVEAVTLARTSVLKYGEGR